MDMRNDLFAEYSYGKVALQKIGATDPSFKLFFAGWLGDGKKREVMRVKGAIFREAKSGPNKGQLCIKVPDTERSALVTSHEMGEYEAANPAH